LEGELCPPVSNYFSEPLKTSKHLLHMVSRPYSVYL
jgi:hypothetical protein